MPEFRETQFSLPDRKFLFEYRFLGETFGITIHAPTAEIAREKIKQVAFAQYKGEVAMRIKVPGGNFLRRLFGL